MSAIRLVLWTGGDDGPLAAALRRLPDVEVVPVRDAAQCAAALGNADALVGNTPHWTQSLAAAASASPRLRWLQLVNAGYDNIEEFGLASHIVVTTRGAAGANVIAEHAMTLLLASLRRIPAAVTAAAAGRWGISAQAATVRSLSNLHVAIIGFGPIGRELRARLGPFGGRVTAVARSARTEADGANVEALASLPRLLREVDAVIIACPLTRETEGLFGARLITTMKPGGHLVNVARGRIVDTAALIAALRSGHLAGAALDVTDPEPLPAEHPLWRSPNLLVTPHIAFLGGGAAVRTQVEALVVDNARRFIAGEPLRHQAVIDHSRAKRF